MAIADNKKDEARQTIEDYLGKLRKRLRGMNPEAVREIVEELRAHIAEKAAAGGDVTPAAVSVALAGLGSVEELASQYLADDLLSRAEVNRSPLRILKSLFRWASLSVAGFLVLLGSIIGYSLGGALVLCALLKPFHPHHVGLWVFPSGTGDNVISLRLGFSSVAPVGGKELLGWWIIPVGLVAGCALVMLTTRFALWCARQYRKSRVIASPPAASKN